MVETALLVFPKLALGLSGFETGAAAMPLIKGGPGDSVPKVCSRHRFVFRMDRGQPDRQPAEVPGNRSACTFAPKRLNDVMVPDGIEAATSKHPSTC
ncbi:hypothetical protein ACSVDM_03515 [Nocardia sp. JW2]|uniref:hypothetical protein n=1 Tax=Nocardia sp. JW2 TaxID=3450738 RepID=UPI003F4363F5